MTDAIGQWKYGYDGMDRLTDKTNNTVAGLAAHWDYDRAGNLLDMQTSHSSETNYTIACPELWRRNALNRLSGVNNLGEQVPASYSAVYPERSRRDAVGNLSGMTIGKLSSSHTYDPRNRPAAKSQGRGESLTKKNGRQHPEQQANMT